jgi:hypothetical protein
LLEFKDMSYTPVNESVRNRSAIILAAGEGVRLRSFVESFRGDALPKQYVKFSATARCCKPPFAERKD